MNARAPLPDWYDDLPGSLAAAWSALERGARDRRSPLHCACIGSIGPDGAPRQRVMILRDVDSQTRALRFHTDRRSDKIAEFCAHPRASLLFYDPPGKLQIRIEGEARLHAGDAVAEAAWQAAQRMSRVCYGIQPGSGAAIEAGGAFTLPDAADAPAIEAGYAHFAVLMVRVRALEWLYLAHEGHRRARFEWGEGDAMKAGWRAP